MTPTPEQIRRRLSAVRCFLLDMDGTFYLGDRLIDGSLEFLDALARTGRTARFLTNNSSKSARVYTEKLARMGVPEVYRDVISSGHAAAHYCMAHFPGKRCYLLGNPMLREEMLSMGLNVVDGECDYVLVAFDTTLDYAKMTRVCDEIRAGKSKYQFIEVMGCPGGCIAGGGQPYVKPCFLPNEDIDILDNYREKRAQALYSEDERQTIRQSHNNKQIQQLYSEYLGEPNSHRAHELLHTHYHAREGFNDLKKK